MISRTTHQPITSLVHYEPMHNSHLTLTLPKKNFSRISMKLSRNSKRRSGMKYGAVSSKIISPHKRFPMSTTWLETHHGCDGAGCLLNTEAVVRISATTTGLFQEGVTLAASKAISRRS